MQGWVQGSVQGSGRGAELLTVVCCAVGAVVVVVAAQRARSRRKVKEKIQRALERRAESLQQAEEAVLGYKRTVRDTLHLSGKSLQHRASGSGTPAARGAAMPPLIHLCHKTETRLILSSVTRGCNFKTTDVYFAGTLIHN